MNKSRPHIPSEKEVYDNKFQSILAELMSTARGAKTSDYGETWKRLGLMGIYVKLFIKEGRLNNLVWGHKDPSQKNESVRDTLIDMACYAIYGIICLDENNMDGKEAKQEHEMEMLNTLKRRLLGVEPSDEPIQESFHQVLNHLEANGMDSISFICREAVDGKFAKTLNSYPDGEDGKRHYLIDKRDREVKEDEEMF